jgi:beta-glucanase (GH16 family)
MRLLIGAIAACLLLAAPAQATPTKLQGYCGYWTALSWTGDGSASYTVSKQTRTNGGAWSAWTAISTGSTVTGWDTNPARVPYQARYKVNGTSGDSTDYAYCFRDDFDSLDTSWRRCWHFNSCTNGARQLAGQYATGEVEGYPPENTYVASGKLVEKAEHRTISVENYCGGGNVSLGYASGVATTGKTCSLAPSFAFTYGTVEFLAKPPAGQGFWTGLGLYPVNLADLPDEIDIVELLGRDPSDAYMSFHSSMTNTTTGYTDPSFTSSYHTYGIVWSPGHIDWKIDGVVRKSYSGSDVPDSPMYLYTTLVIGGTWPGQPDGTTPFPSYLYIDSASISTKNVSAPVP